MDKQSIFLSALFICVSCTVGPSYEQPQIFSDNQIKNELQLKASDNLSANQFRTLHDDYLRNLIKTGLKNNSDILKAQTKLKQARYTTAINKADFLPQINLSGDYNYQKTGSKSEYLQNADYYKAGFDASWELDIWGKGRRQNEADKATENALINDLNNMRIIIAAEIALNYVYLLQSKENLRITEKNAKLQKQIADIIKKEYQAGIGDAVDYNQSQYLLQTTLAKIPQYENDIETYKNTLSTLTGILPSQINVPTGTNLLNDNYTDVLQNMRNLPLKVIRARPDVAAAEQRLKAQSALVGKAIAEMYPDISINAFFGSSTPNERNLFSSVSKVYGYTPNINLPLLDWNKLQNNKEFQKQAKIAALTDYKQSVLNAVTELKNAFSNCETSFRAYLNKLSALNNIQKVNNIMLNRYHNGLVKFSEVLNSQQDLLKAQEELVSSRTQVIISLISYYKAIGITIDN